MFAGTSESALVLLNFASRYRTASGPGSPSGQPAWGGGCDRPLGTQSSRLLNVRSAALTFKSRRDACVLRPVATARGSVTLFKLDRDKLRHAHFFHRHAIKGACRLH